MFRKRLTYSKRASNIRVLVAFSFDWVLILLEIVGFFLCYDKSLAKRLSPVREDIKECCSLALAL